MIMKEKTTCSAGLFLNIFNVSLLENEVLVHDASPNILHILYNSLKVGCSIVRASDKDVISTAVGCGSVQGLDLNEPRAGC